MCIVPSAHAVILYRAQCPCRDYLGTTYLACTPPILTLRPWYHPLSLYASVQCSTRYVGWRVVGGRECLQHCCSVEVGASSRLQLRAGFHNGEWAVGIILLQRGPERAYRLLGAISHVRDDGDGPPLAADLRR